MPFATRLSRTEMRFEPKWIRICEARFILHIYFTILSAKILHEDGHACGGKMGLFLIFIYNDNRTDKRWNVIFSKCKKHWKTQILFTCRI